MKKVFTKYNAETGDIISIFSCLDGEQHVNAPCVEGSYAASEYRIIDGEPVRKDIAEIESAAIQQAWIDLRLRRKGLLKDSDWTQVPDAPVDRAAWAVYRQALRDLPANTADPRDPQWPTPPE